MGDPDSLVCELAAIDALATSAVLVGDVSALHHELRDDAVEDVVLVAEALVASADGSEVLSSLGHMLVEQLKHHSALLESFFALFTDGKVEVGLGVACGELWQGQILLDLGDRLLAVESLGEDCLHLLLLGTQVICTQLLDFLELVSQVLVSRA